MTSPIPSPHQMLLRLLAIAAILMLCFIPTTLWGQNWKVKGLVLDAETGEPLPNAKIQWVGQKSGCQTDVNGEFSLPVQVVAPVVSAQMDGYDPLILRTMQASGDQLIFHLRPINYQLETVTIFDQRVEPAFADPTTHIQDYTFFGDHLLLASWNSDQKLIQLKLAQPDGEIILSHPGIQEKKGEFTTDCLGNRFFLTEKMAYQVFIDGASILLLPSKRSEFEEYANPCKGMINNSFFVYHRLSDFREFYELVNGHSLERQLLVFIQDSLKLGYTKDDSIMEAKGFSASQVIARDAVHASRMAGTDKRFAELTLLNPNYSPLEIIKGTALVFCHSENRIRCFTENGDFIKDVPITYHRTREWARQVLADEEEQNIYTLTEKKGFYILHEIDTDSGQIIESWDLEKPFISHISVKGGYVYFLYREKDIDIEKRLWRIKL